MPRVILAVLAVLCLALPARADLEGGRRAFERGDYAAAERQWRALAEQGEAEAQFDMGVLFAHARGRRRDYQ
ncbi:MAG: sel1 repeat family protein, partial [Alphaproteobacteria bacterium]